MNRLFTIVLLSTVTFMAKAQYVLDQNLSGEQVIENNNAYMLYPTGNFVNRTDNLLSTYVHNGINDTILFPVSVGAITPTDPSSDDTGFDTLMVDIAFESFGYSGAADYATSIHHTKAASYTIYSRFNTYSFTNISPTAGGYTVYKSYKFKENSIDTLKLVVTGGTLSLDRIRLDFGTKSVIANASQDLFGDGKNAAHFNNPVKEGQLSISLPNDFTSASITLISMEGIVVASKEIRQGDSTVDVSHLKSGLYLIRDTNTGSTTKVMIQ